MSAGRAAIAGDAHGALEWADRAMALAGRLGLENFVSRALQFRGIARCDLDDFRGIDDLRESLRAALERGWTREAGIGFSNYGSWVWLTSGADEALEIYGEGVEFAVRRGIVGPEMWTRAESTWPLFDAGRWDELLDAARVIEEYAAEHGAAQPLLIALVPKARVLFYRGQSDDAATIAADVLPRARAVGDPQIMVPTLSLAALVEPKAEAALAFVEEMLSRGFVLDADAARVCVRHGALDVAARMAEVRAGTHARARHIAATVRAMVAEARGEREEAGRLYADAVQRWTEYPHVLERGLCLLGVARATGNAAAARDARAIFRSLGAEALALEAAAA
jgi:hypothetical protein